MSYVYIGIPYIIASYSIDTINMYVMYNTYTGCPHL